MALPIPDFGQSLKQAAALQGGLASLPAPVLSPVNLSGPAPALSAPALPAAVPDSATPSTPGTFGTQVQRDQDKLNYLRSTGAGVDQIKNPWLHIPAKIADTALQVAGSVFAPIHAIGAAIPGTTFHHQLLVHQAQNNLVADQAAQQEQAKEAETEALTADQQAQTSERESLADKYGSQADSMKPITVTPEMAQAAGIPELAGQTISQPTYQKLFGVTANNAAKQTIAEGHDATKVATTGMNNDTSRANNTANNQTHESVAEAANKTRLLVAQMHDATSRANNQNTNDHKSTGKLGGTSPAGGFKVPADITKRAALANNVNENANAVDALLSQHPDIVGRTGGRYSNVQQMIGSDDPAISELGVRMHNIALASNGAHGVRAQQAIEQTENELFHHFVSGPNAIHGALNATRSSMQTFLDDEKNFQTSGHRTGETGGGNNASGPADYVFVPGKGLVKK